jgi:MFS family permease
VPQFILETRYVNGDHTKLLMRINKLHLYFTLAVLLGINTMNFFDRQILPAVQERIRKEWDLSDFELGVLGTAFILLYAVVGLPLGRLADTGPRKLILAGGVGLWSLMTLGSGLAWNYWSLLLMRLGVGIGEASCAPTSSSLIGDLFPPERRARAMAFFMLGLPIGVAFSFPISSAIAERSNWQAAFFVAALPGFPLALLALLIADRRSDRMKAEDSVSSSRLRPLSFLQVVRQILKMPTMWWIVASGALHNFNMYALGAFLASFLKRYHSVSVERAGFISGLVYGCGALNIFVAGWLGDRAIRKTARGRLHVAWIGLTAATPCLLLAILAAPGELWTCALWLLPGCALLYTYYGTVYATIQDIVAPKLRGTAMAVYFFGMYLLGGSLGPAAIGRISDYRARSIAGHNPVLDWHKAVGLHDAMYLVPALNVLLVLVLFAASRTVRGDYTKSLAQSR